MPHKSTPDPGSTADQTQERLAAAGSQSHESEFFDATPPDE